VKKVFEQVKHFYKNRIEMVKFDYSYNIFLTNQLFVENKDFFEIDNLNVMILATNFKQHFGDDQIDSTEILKDIIAEADCLFLNSNS